MRLELGQRLVEGLEAVVSGGFRADHRAPGVQRQLDALPLGGLARVTFQGYFHIDTDRLLVELHELAQLGRGVVAEALLELVRRPRKMMSTWETPFDRLVWNDTRPADLVFVPTSAC